MIIDRVLSVSESSYTVPVQDTSFLFDEVLEGGLRELVLDLNTYEASPSLFEDEQYKFDPRFLQHLVVRLKKYGNEGALIDEPCRYHTHTADGLNECNARKR